MTSLPASALLLGLALFSVSVARAQEPVQEPESLKKAREAFHQKLRIPTGLMNDFYVKALGASERSFASLGDYKQAMAIKARREQLAAIGLQAATAPSAVVVPLAAEHAKVSGAVTAKGGELINWRTTTCGAEWTLSTSSRITPGAYKLELTYTVAPRPPIAGSTKPAPEPATTLSYVFKDSSLLSAGNKNECLLTLSPTPTFLTLTSEGSIQITRTPVSLKLAAAASYPGNIVVIRDVKLVLAPPASSITNLAPAAVIDFRDELTKLRQSLIDKLAFERKPIVEQYLAKLDALAATTKSDSLADQIDAEKRHAQKALTEVSLKSPRLLDNFTEFDDAHFVPDPSNTGDTFKVLTSDGKQMRVRLAFIACASNDPSAHEMKVVSERFNIDVELALQLATNAQEFTAEYLHDRPLHLLVRHSRKDGESPPAFVFLDQIGLYQNVLLDHGLAVVDLPPGGSKGNTRESEYIALLSEREALARKQTPAPGGWGLSLPNR